jgi:transcriptional regulator with XRE-family HTH domain
MSTEHLSRTARLRQRLAISQAALGQELGVSQSTVDRLEKGQPETGPQARLLDLLELRLAASAGPPSPPAPADCPVS